MLFWTVNTFGIYMISFFLVEARGDIYLNTFAVFLAEFVARLVSGWILEAYGSKVTFLTSYALSVFCCFIYLINISGSNLFGAVLLYGCKWGITVSHNIGYVVTNEAFP
jgi:hypothetical protein